MGDSADDAYEMAMEQEWEYHQQLSIVKKLSDKELYEELHNAMLEDYYEDNEFTPIVLSILEQYEKKQTISDKQRNVLVKHLSIYWSRLALLE